MKTNKFGIVETLLLVMLIIALLILTIAMILIGFILYIFTPFWLFIPISFVIIFLCLCFWMEVPNYIIYHDAFTDEDEENS